ncbi:MAG: helix-turn-helix domain-containing protein [Candidatus Endonucleobacter sp. (ex Gigantidas childressi)]|nr:helix-turn-helix domain-containing protein [Candidatus Endonucleobacter sp. (ex Gigantidas childressi)]
MPHFRTKKSGCSQREVAKIIGTSQSTVSRELARNTGERGYRHRQAQGRTDRRRTESARASRMIAQRSLTINRVSETGRLIPSLAKAIAGLW